MRLTRFTDYSLRVLIYAGINAPELSTISEIAEKFAVDHNHLSKIVHALGRAGYLDTSRGRNGGLRLAHHPSGINIGSVVRLTEQDFYLVECFVPCGDKCRIEPSCVLGEALEEAMGQFFKVLDRYTLADLIAPRAELSELLDLSGH